MRGGQRRGNDRKLKKKKKKRSTMKRGKNGKCAGGEVRREKHSGDQKNGLLEIASRARRIEGVNGG